MAPHDVPPFRLILPAGWEQLPADRESVARLRKSASGVFRSQHRPDLDSEFSQMMGLSEHKMKQGGVFALYLQESVPPEEFLPMSMTGAIAQGQLGGTLDRQVSSLFRDQQAEFLTEDRAIVRWQSEVVHTGKFAGASSRTLSYLIAIPGSERRRAILFTTTIPYVTGEGDENRELIDELTLLSDTMISTFAWEPTR